MKLITKLRKADHQKKNQIWNNACVDMTRDQADSLVREMILSLPGYYHLRIREYGDNLVDKMYETYGWMPSMLVSEPMIRGLAILHPDKVYAAFTHGLDIVEVKP